METVFYVMLVWLFPASLCCAITAYWWSLMLSNSMSLSFLSISCWSTAIFVFKRVFSSFVMLIWSFRDRFYWSKSSFSIPFKLIYVLVEPFAMMPPASRSSLILFLLSYIRDAGLLAIIEDFSRLSKMLWPPTLNKGLCSVFWVRKAPVLTDCEETYWEIRGICPLLFIT